MCEDIPADFTQFGTGQPGETIYDFTSQPMPDFSEQMDTSNIHMNDLSIFKLDEANPTLVEISRNVNRPPPLVFYEMLAKMQKG